MARKSDWEGLQESLEEVLRGEPRSAIIVGVSVLEIVLEAVTKTKLRKPANGDEEGRIFGDLFPDFHRKIWAAYFLNLIGPHTRADLDTIRRIRNECAHNLGRISFDLPRIADMCNSLRTPKRRMAKRGGSKRWRDTPLAVVGRSPETVLEPRVCFTFSVLGISFGLLPLVIFEPEAREMLSEGVGIDVQL